MNFQTPLTKKEQFVLDYIRTFQKAYGTYPTYREIMTAAGASSVNSVSQYLKQLETKGEIEMIKNKGYRLTRRDEEMTDGGYFAFPLLGSVPAGGPSSTQELEDTMKLPASFVRKATHTFILQVRGESMRDAGILPGDFVFVERREAKVNDIVVALLDGENTVKRLVSQNGKRYLKAENPDYSDIHPQSEWEIQGVVVGLWRKYE